MSRKLYHSFILLTLLMLNGCSTLSYYSHVARGHMDVMSKRTSVNKVLADEEADAKLKEKLQFVLQVREFAVENMHLPDNRSYQVYADIGRPYITWNVVATPAYSLRPEQWCFLFAGCVVYRGFFAEQKAEAFAQPLRDEGKDVVVYGATAYSTLGWFADPILNTMLRQNKLSLAAVIIHELAHQQLYIKDDSRFNEAFATAVQYIGLERWLALYGTEEEKGFYQRALQKRAMFNDLVKASRAKLELLYSSSLPEAEKAERKAAIYAELKASHAEMQARFGGKTGYERWFSESLNNAKLVTVATYYDLVPFFRHMFTQEKTLPAFYEAVKALGKQKPADRQRLIDQFFASQSKQD